MNELQGINIYLIGMMGVGKSTVGKVLARKLNYRFFDTDTLIEQSAPSIFPELSADDGNMGIIKQMFTKLGETQFRDFETQILAEVSKYNKSAIATGGGIVERRENWSFLQYGLVVWLDASEEIIYKRLHQDQQSERRPLLEQLSSRLKHRLPLYQQADLKIAIAETSTPETVATEIIEMIPSVLKSKPASST
jgi:shikimate kinase